KYSVASGAVDNPIGSHNEAFEACPRGSKPLGGGAFSSSGSTAVNLNSTYPSGNGWRAAEDNNSGSNATVPGLVICGRIKGYNVVVGPEVATPGLTQTGIAIECPAPTVPIGGGVLSLTGNLAVNLNSTEAFDGTWESFINSATPNFETAIPLAVC